MSPGSGWSRELEAGVLSTALIAKAVQRDNRSSPAIRYIFPNETNNIRGLTAFFLDTGSSPKQDLLLQLADELRFAPITACGSCFVRTPSIAPLRCSLATLTTWLGA